MATKVGYALDRRAMAGNTIGKLSEFDPTSDSVSAYVERANLFFEANEIAAAKRVAVFLRLYQGKRRSTRSLTY